MCLENATAEWQKSLEYRSKPATSQKRYRPRRIWSAGCAMMASITPHAMTATRFRSAHSRPVLLRKPRPRKSGGVLPAERAPAPAASTRNAPPHRHPTMPRNSREPTLARQWELLKLR